jgi:hypothetical protein
MGYIKAIYHHFIILFLLFSGRGVFVEWTYTAPGTYDPSRSPWYPWELNQVISSFATIILSLSRWSRKLAGVPGFQWVPDIKFLLGSMIFQHLTLEFKCIQHIPQANSASFGQIPSVSGPIRAEFPTIMSASPCSTSSAHISCNLGMVYLKRPFFWMIFRDGWLLGLPYNILCLILGLKYNIYHNIYICIGFTSNEKNSKSVSSQNICNLTPTY